MVHLGLSIAVALSLLCAPGRARADIYQWTDENGTVHFTPRRDEVPASQRDSAVRHERSAPAPAGASQPPAAAAPPSGVVPGVFPSRQNAQAVAASRQSILERTPTATQGLDTTRPVYGVLMETGYPNGAASLVAFENASASLYLSEGGGVFGGESVPAIAAAAQRLTQLAGAQLAQFTPADATPWPKAGEVRFYLLTAQGVRTAVAQRGAIERRDHPLGALFRAGHDVITRLREASEARAATR